MTRTPASRAVLLAAGRGTRLGAITANYPKALLQVGGRPVIVHILDGLAATGIRDVTIVTGHFAALLEAEIGGGEQSGFSVRYVRQERLDGTARALNLVRPELGQERFFFGWGDILVRPANYRAVLRAARFADAVLAVNHVDDPADGGAVYVDDEMQVTALIEKPGRGQSSTNWNNAGFGVLGPEIWEFIDALDPSERGEYELPRAIGAMVSAGVETRAVAVEGPWFDIGTPEALDAARKAFR